MSNHYDIIVLGAGPGGYVGAIRAAQLGKKVAIIEKRAADAKTGPSLGGTCLNVGCIPSKALLDSSEHFHNATHVFAEHGIEVGTPHIDLGKMLQRKDKVVRELAGGVSGLMKKNKITVFAGHGRLTGPGRVQVTGSDSKTTDLEATDIVLAMGSVPIDLPFLPVDGKRIVTSDQAIAFEKVPEKLVIVGGGVIGLELGSVWARLGSEVTIIEFLDRIAPSFEAAASKALQKSLSKLGMKFHLKTKVTGTSDKDGGLVVNAETADGKKLEFPADKVLVAVGRRPLIEDCGLEKAGVKLTDKKRVAVDKHLQTSVPHIWAIGDLIDGPMLAHKAEEEGVAVAETISGMKGHVDLAVIPNVVYTWPELASVGKTEAELKEAGRSLKIGNFQYLANGRAKAAGEVDGFVKVIADAETDDLLGVTIYGPRASDLIAEAVAVMAFGGSAEDIALLCHAHPTFSEALKEAALDSQGRVIHS